MSLPARPISLPQSPPPALVRFDDFTDAVYTDVLIVGSGAAALRAAIEAGRARDVLMLTKRGTSDSSSHRAQGGIAVAIGEGDTVEDHVQDTLVAGAGLCDEEVVREFLRDGVECVRELLDWGARFDQHEGRLHFGREGAHKRARVLHRADGTGAEIHGTLVREASRLMHIRTLDEAFAVDLLKKEGRCVGVLAFHGGRLRPFLAPHTILATGGLNRIFRETTNPAVSTGDGMAMAFRAGAEVQDMEMVQFHPTTLYLAGTSRALISEAVRGAGGYLRDRDGVRFMEGAHEMAELAPRDIVSRCILNRMLDTKDTQVYLDVRHFSDEKLDHFPGLIGLCRKYGLDVKRDLIPVRPSAHYTIGGVRTDLIGRTSLPGLYACGECAATGFHGANRLASNSLLECLVAGRRVGREVMENTGPCPRKFEPLQGPVAPVRDLDVQDMSNSLRSLLTRNAGIVRDAGRLQEALSRRELWSRYVLNNAFEEPGGWELQNELISAELLARSALVREESRGVHYRSDFPEPKDDWKVHLTVRR